jgi:ketosteroid isomerase-like protein
MSEQTNIQLLRDLYAAFGRGDIQAILEHCSEDITWGDDTVATEVPWYGLKSGREGVANFFATLQRDVEFTQFNPSVFAATGNDVFVFVEIGYRFRKNGRSTSVGSMHRFVLDGPVLRSFRAYEDTAAVRDAWNA